MKREVASLTKMMTAYTILEICKQYRLKLNAIRIEICSVGSNIRGTSAKLRQGDCLSAEQLMYGMMLPSGNDAAVALGTHFGGIIKSEGKLDPEIVISQEAIERRLRAIKIVRARDYLEQLE